MFWSERESAACGCGKRTLLQFPSTAAAQKTELRAAFLRQEVASQGFRSYDSAERTIQGIETVNMIRKGQVKWLPKDDIAGQVAFVAGLFGLIAVA